MVQEKKSLDEQIEDVRSFLGEGAAKRWGEIGIYGVGGTLALGLLTRVYKHSVGMLPGPIENDPITTASLVGAAVAVAYLGYSELKSYLKQN